MMLMAVPAAGGTCEATVYDVYGFMTGSICVALGNYHNMDTTKKRIAEEIISRADAEDLVAVTTELCFARKPTADPLKKLREDLHGYAQDARKRMREG